MPRKVKKHAKKAKKLAGKRLQPVKTLVTPAAPSPIPVPYPNLY